jgi:hypothetical protein
MMFVHRSAIGSTVGLLGQEHRHDAGNTHVGQALHAVEILAKAERGDLDGIRIAAGLLLDSPLEGDGFERAVPQQDDHPNATIVDSPVWLSTKVEPILWPLTASLTHHDEWK